MQEGLEKLHAHIILANSHGVLVDSRDHQQCPKQSSLILTEYRQVRINPHKMQTGLGNWHAHIVLTNSHGILIGSRDRQQCPKRFPH